MWVVAGLLMVAVIYLASKAPSSNPATGALPPNTAIPSQGTSGIPSPATTNGSPLGTAAGQVALNTNYQLPQEPLAGGSTPYIPPPNVVDPSKTQVPVTDVRLNTQTTLPTPGQVAWLRPGTFRKL